MTRAGMRYDAELGGRVSPDPLGHAASMSLYDYANGDPVNGLDPDGRCPQAANTNQGQGASTVVTGQNLSFTSNNQTYTIQYNGSGTPFGNVPLNQSTREGSPIYDPVSQTVGYTGLAASTLQYSTAGQYSVGSNYKVYTSGWGGNGSVSTAKLAGIADIAGRGLAIGSIAFDAYGYNQGNISGAHLATNTTMTGVGVYGGWPGAAVAGSYFLIDTFYPPKDPKAGGAAAFAQDVAPIVTKPLTDGAKAGLGMPIILRLW